MANYDGPLFSMSATAILTEANPERDNWEPAFWNTSGTFALADWVGSGSGGPVTPEGDPIYGYGWGLSG